MKIRDMKIRDMKMFPPPPSDAFPPLPLIAPAHSRTFFIEGQVIGQYENFCGQRRAAFSPGWQ
jgi:hypothetical protein